MLKISILALLLQSSTVSCWGGPPIQTPASKLMPAYHPVPDTRTYYPKPSAPLYHPAPSTPVHHVVPLTRHHSPSYLPNTLSDLFPSSCVDQNIPSLEGQFKKAKVCCPKSSNGEKFPVTIYQHGDGEGGPSLNDLNKMLEKMSEEGVCVVAPYSCAVDNFNCQNGEVSYLEVLKTLLYLEQNKAQMAARYSFDFSLPYVVGGHSTGARVALMIGALVDTYQGAGEAPLYLKGTNAGKGLTAEMIAVLPKIKAVVGDHPDPMSDLAKNPDPNNYKIDKTPVFIITGTADYVEPMNSGWEDFRQVTSPTKIFVDVQGEGMLEPIISHDEVVPIVNFYKAFVYKTISQEYFYGPDKIMGNDLKIAAGNSRDSGTGGFGYLACIHTGITMSAVSIPAGYSDQYCLPPRPPQNNQLILILI